jgi:molybdenum cofactor guanylyltransferase
MTGVILCGGQSTRMGVDKGLLKLHANTWAQTAVDKMVQLNIPVVLSVNHQQFEEYATVFDAGKLVTDNPLLKLKGPLLGVLSVHLLYPHEHLLVLACDMPLMETSLLKQLPDAFNNDANHNAFVFINNNEPEPLCGIYTAPALAHIYQLYQANKLVKHSMKFALENMHVAYLPVKPAQQKFFRNFNAHAELNGL